MSDTALTTTRVIKAPPDRVFEAWTTPALLVKWWGPGAFTCPEAEVDLREGGSYRIANKDPDGSVSWILGEFSEVRAPDRLVYTWKFKDAPGEPTLVTVEFNPHPDGTELVLTHERFAAPAVRDMHLQGWEGCIDKLVALLEA